ncbi:MAG: glucuronate isomerase [Gemmataceae bacterium]|nr:glucuronate isomerase [Gemmataceae bacterium]
MLHDRLAEDLYAEICRIPLIDPHSHINPHKAASRSLDDILGYHYYTELAHSAGMEQTFLGPDADPRDRVRDIVRHMNRYDNTAQYQWFLEIARTFLGFEGERVTIGDCTWLCDQADKLMAQSDWEQQVLKKSNLEKVFLTNDFDDPLEGFDTAKYVPCLRTDDLVFHLDKPEVRQRLAKATGTDNPGTAIRKLFEHFVHKGARACAISLPPDFSPSIGKVKEGPHAIFWILAEHCREFKLPFDLMIGVNRNVYKKGVHQGRDLYDQRTSLIQYAELFNAFPEVTFPISVLSSPQNQELVSYSWIFPNVVPFGHWWYSNIPAFIAPDLRARLQAVPKVKQLGYYSDAYKLEFCLPKYNMYRRILAQTLAEDFVRPRVATESQAIQLARLLLRDNARRIFDA